MLAIDTETTGVDFWHGAKPFFVTTSDPAGKQQFWEWPVDPVTRQPKVPPEDVEAIASAVKGAKRVVGQNFKFDAHALRTVGVPQFPFGKLDDTLVASHLLASNQSHNLTDLVTYYLGEAGIDILPYERDLAACVKEARGVVQRAKLRRKRRTARLTAAEVAELGGQAEEEDEDAELTDWAIAAADLRVNGRLAMPSAGEEVWRADYWLPRALATHLSHPQPVPWCRHEWGEDRLCAHCGGHHYHAALRDYSNADSYATVKLWERLSHQLAERKLEKIYRLRMKLVGISYKMEHRGVTKNAARQAFLEGKYREEVEDYANSLVVQAASDGYELQLPKGASPNKSLRTYCFDVLKLPRYYDPKAKSGEPSLKKEYLQKYLDELPPGHKRDFVESLTQKRKRDSYLSYMEGYARYRVPLPGGGDTYVLHPSLNMTGTDTLRWSSSNPNEQNISKRGLKEGDPHTLRYLFGPGPGREWHSFDYENIELRIPGFTAPEPAMIALFERPDEAPFFGSYHLMNASIIYPDLFWPLADKKGAFKEKYEGTWYGWCKNAGFALIYGCQERQFDATAHKPGAYQLLKAKLPNLFALAERCIAHANRYGYVETLPDRTVDPERGYPVMTQRREYGRVSPTIPLNYLVQSTAMWCTGKAMVRVDEFFAHLNRGGLFRGKRWPGGYYIALQVHDELVPDMPARGRENLPVVERVQELMEQSGDDIGIPLTVSRAYHSKTWSQKEKMAV